MAHKTPDEIDDQLPPMPPNNEEAEERYKASRFDTALANNPNKISRLQREMYVERMLLEGVAEGVVAEIAAGKTGKAESTIRKDIQAVKERWVQDDNSQRTTYKSTAMRRIQGHIRAAREAEAWGAVGSLERLLAQIQGTMEPVQVDVEFVMRGALADYITSLSTEELEDLAHEQRDMERKAAMYERGIDPQDVLDTEGETVTH